MRKLAITVIVVVGLGLVMLAMSMAQNDGCLPWQESVGTKGSPFAGTKDVKICR